MKYIQDPLKVFFKWNDYLETRVKISGRIYYRSTFLLNETFACLPFVSKASSRGTMDFPSLRELFLRNGVFLTEPWPVNRKFNVSSID